MREASQRTAEMRKNKFRKLYASAASVFGFIGAAYLDQKMITTAAQQALTTTLCSADKFVPRLYSSC